VHMVACTFHCFKVKESSLLSTVQEGSDAVVRACIIRAMGCKPGRSRGIISVSPGMGLRLLEGERSRLTSVQFCKVRLSPCQTSTLQMVAMLATQTWTVARQFLFLICRTRN